jgi:hypothetical protein
MIVFDVLGHVVIGIVSSRDCRHHNLDLGVGVMMAGVEIRRIRMGMTADKISSIKQPQLLRSKAASPRSRLL